MLRYRLITGPLLILLLLVVVVADNALDQIQLSGIWQDLFMGKDHPPRGLLLFGMAMLVMAPLAALEFSHVVAADDIMVRRWLMIFAADLGLILSYSIPQHSSGITAVATVATGIILVFIASILTFSRGRNVKGVVAAGGAVMFTLVYIGLMLGFLLAIRRSHDAWIIVGVIMTTKSCDIGAYFTGRLAGRRKLIPWLSPGKTWEGLIGGVLTSALVGLLLAIASRALPASDQVSPTLGLVAGGIFGLVGQFGDLTMSLFKRGAGLKDSSTILPGMGGVLDVLDSPLMVAPVAYWLLTLY